MATEELIVRVGKAFKKFKSCPNKDAVVPLLKDAANALAELDHLETPNPSVQSLSCSLIKHGLLQHKDKDVQLLVSICFCEILRILAPNPDFSDAVRKDRKETMEKLQSRIYQEIFKLFLSQFSELADTKSPYLSKRVKVLETVEKLNVCVLMLDTNCKHLVVKMFNTFFTVIRESHPGNLFRAMSSIMVHISKDEVSESAVNLVLHNLLIAKKDASPAAYRLALSVIEDCTGELERYVCEFLNSCIINRDAVQNELTNFYHEIIFEIFQCAPKKFQSVIPNLTLELLADQVDIRIKATDLVGRLLVIPGHHVAQDYRHLFVEFLKRLSDKSADVRITAINRAKDFYNVNPHGAVSCEILTALEARLLDFDDRVRSQAVVTVCDLAKGNLKSIPHELISRATERLQDKRVSVRKKAMQKLLEVYRDYCAKCSTGTMSPSDIFEQIPCKLLMLCHNKDCTESRPQNMELVLAEELFPASLPLEERTRHWIFLFSLFKPAHLNSLNTILFQKRRLQSEMDIYLALRSNKENIQQEDVEKRVQACVAKMSALFPDPKKAEENFHRLLLLEDENIFATLQQLLNEVTLTTAESTRDNFLKKLGNKHPHFEFLQLLSKKCLFNIFSSEHVHCIADDLLSNNGDNMENCSVKLFLAIISAFPALLRSLEKKFRLLLLKNKIPVNEQLMRILAHAGPSVHIKLSDIYSSLERVCLDGTRTQSKLAVSTITALTDASEQLVLTGLCESLVDALHSGQNIPTVLQSLGCMAQYSPSSFESRAGEIYQYIFERFFQPTDVQGSEYLDSSEEISGCDVSTKCKFQILALKTLVKSFLPHKSTTFRGDIVQLFEVLSEILQNGFILLGETPCEPDKASIKLAAAKSVLRLSRKWDLHIPPQLFHLTISTAKDSSPYVRRQLINKIHKLLSHHAVPKKYACAFALSASDTLKDIRDDSRKYMEDFVRECRRQAKICRTSKKPAVTDCPEYIVVFLIHLLAHDTCFPSANCDDEEICIQFLSPLVMVLQTLVSSSSTDGDKNVISATVSCLRFIFLAIKMAEDVVDACITPKLYMLADMGISIVNSLNCNTNSGSYSPGPILLPSSLYRINSAEKREEAYMSSSGQCPFNATITKKVVSGMKSRVPWLNMAVNKPSQRVHDSSQSDIIKCSMKKADVCKNNDMPMNMGDQIQCSYAPGQEMHETINLDTNTRKSRKRALCPSPPEAGGMHNDFSIDNEVEHGVPVSSEPITGVELPEKLPLSSSPPRSGGLHNEFSLDDDAENSQFVDSEPLTGREQLSSSCDSASALNILPQSKDVNSSDSLTAPNSRKTVMVPSKCARGAGRIRLKHVGNTQTALVGQRIRLWSQVDKCYYSGTVVGFNSGNDTHKVMYDSGELEVVNLKLERWETMSNDSPREKDSNSSSSQHFDFVDTQSQMINISRDGISQPKSIVTKENKILPKKRIIRPGKENKGHNSGMNTSASEIININEEHIAKRTRSQR